MPYVKKDCYVVRAFYKEDPELPVGCEEVVCTSPEVAQEQAEEFRTDLRFEPETVRIDQEERSVYVRRNGR